ncbi:DUF6452 family protein [Zhouia amylolytica]|uniref:Lipoprotein n=1 Tax=Zhouia amylolytica AD3 TaxID=1286632 RepID=W2URL1_9FLAO|nr:DUF6452 family protein [Zhouia amylolytica]ETN96121.1 hypothetical protein P278_18430 [Zhouia amylolytica AD3]
MKKIFLPALIILLIFIGVLSCEKDDICPPDSAITPNLVIRFYDADNPQETKLVNNLRIIGVGQETDAWPLSTTDSVAIPLKSFANSSSFVFIMDSAIDETGSETGVIDTLTFNYGTEEVFISRGCGYVSYYNNLGYTPDSGTEGWVSRLRIISTDIENQNQAHVQIFH